MKFRRLSQEELSHLEKEFIEFLVSNTITADDWVSIKKNKPDETNRLIDLFSDIVLEKVYSKMVLLEKREKNNLLFFKFKDNMIETIGVTSKNDRVDFNLPESFDESVFSGLEGFRQTRIYQESEKSKEVFQLVQAGCVIGNAELYKTLEGIIK